MAINALIAFMSALLGIVAYVYLFPNEAVIYKVKENSANINKVAFTELIAETSDFTKAVEKAMPAVVHIQVIKPIKVGEFQDGSSDGPSMDGNDQYRQESNGESNQVIRKQGFRYSEDEKESISGSGVIISSNGYIVTNAHVIENAELIEISLENRKQYFAELIATDFATDLALLKIEGSNLPYIEYGNSDLVRVGHWVLAVGNPYNLSSTVTAGIVSAKGRNLNFTGNAVEAYIQSDAAVNEGNSGGALVNTKGQLIGLNSAIATSSGKFEGYSFAIPSNLVNKIVTDLKIYGYVRRPALGLGLRDLSPELDGRLDSFDGALIVDLEESSPAYAAGLQINDLIIKANGYPVENMNDLQEQIIQIEPGQNINVSFIRNKALKHTKIQLQNHNLDSFSRKIEDLLGLKLNEISMVELNKFGVDNGLQVVNISKGLVYKNTNIKKNFIITHLNNQKIYDLRQFHDLLFAIEEGMAVSFKGKYPFKNSDDFYSFGMKRGIN